MPYVKDRPDGRSGDPVISSSAVIRMLQASPSRFSLPALSHCRRLHHRKSQPKLEERLPLFILDPNLHGALARGSREDPFRQFSERFAA
jgi:hypothetical protein